jgi:4-aminobutyrate aminotransferase-like enzyme
VGRYDEPRRWYSSPLFESSGNDGLLHRTVHLGIDLFAPAGTPVLAPLDGVVRSVADNRGSLDYGPTVLLEHRVEDEDGPLTFHTLYGHLARESVEGLEPGRPVEAGQVFAALGSEEENGGWAPHLHLQVVGDRLGFERDYPGVALPRDSEVWLSLSPDPAPLLPVAIPEPDGSPSLDTREIRDYRVRHVGPNLSLSYRRPLHIVRGWMQHLWDAEGERHLDGVNNVAHVGHCHPRVTEALQRQAGVLNTNTRYLHEGMVRYVQDLLATFPEPLRVAYLVCSGSEANELALRLARAHTGRSDLVALESGYHGNTTLLVEASHYKSAGPGGAGPGDWVHTAPVPDTYRGRHRIGSGGTAAEVGQAYVREVEAVIAGAEGSGRPVGAILAESVLGCAGQIVLPEGYLEGAYRAVRDAGGVCIADEVQVGFGRVGTHFWGFQTQGVVPDIVTLGKPIGNGHPMGAVVTTEEIAASFDNGMEYFNTFGGNPVSCAVGRAVLDVIRDEGLQARAREVGAELKAGLEEVAARRPIMGEVRGLGLFLGIELVTDPDTRTPAGPHASYVANRLRDRGILVSTDGPDHNVLKIKPPLQFSSADARRLVESLDHVLGEEPVLV